VISRNGKNDMRIFGRFLGAGLFALTFLAFPAKASAGILTYSLTNSDLGGSIDQHYMYSWRIDGINPGAGKTVTGATLTFTNISNWNSGTNELFVHLFDTAINSGLSNQLEESTAINPVDNLDDELTGKGLNQTGTCNASTGAGCDYTFNYLHSDGVTKTPTASTLFATGTANTFLESPSFTTTGTNSVYNFTGAQILSLNNYISSGQNIAIGLDPDCHFFLSGVTLQLTTGPLATVPEPASLTLMGLGLAAWYRRRRTQTLTA
jgi:hypothetical protein